MGRDGSIEYLGGPTAICICFFGKAEVSEHHVALGIQHTILRFQVPVDDAF